MAELEAKIEEDSNGSEKEGGEAGGGRSSAEPSKRLVREAFRRAKLMARCCPPPLLPSLLLPACHPVGRPVSLLSCWPPCKPAIPILLAALQACYLVGRLASKGGVSMGPACGCMHMGPA